MANEKDLKNIDITKTEEKNVTENKVELSTEEKKKREEELLKEFMDKNTKELSLPALSDSYKKEARLIAIELNKVKKEVEEKRTSFIDLYKSIENKLEALSKAGQIQLKEEDYKKSKETFVRYENYLNQVLGEVIGDLSFFSSLIAEKPLEKIRVFKDVTDDSEQYLNDKLKAAKKYIKKMLKDLRISYSRYEVGFQEQIKKLDYLVAYLKASQLKNAKKEK